MSTHARSQANKALRTALVGVSVRVFVLASLGAGLVGCGSDTSPVDDFIGTWHYTDATSVLQCVDRDPLNQPPASNKTFARGISAALVDLSVSPLGLSNGVVCDFGFDVAGPVATAQAKQSCAITTLDTVTIDQPNGAAPLWTFTLNSATTAEELATATVHLVLPGVNIGDPPQDQACSWMLIGHLTRISKQ
jgi:hypothetical protein